MAVCVVLTTVGDLKTAQRLARKLLSDKLSACVTVVPKVVSYYRWKGKMERSNEALLLIKTNRRLWPQIQHFLKSNHPYSMPEVLALPVSFGSKEYLSWLGHCLKKK